MPRLPDPSPAPLGDPLDILFQSQTMDPMAFSRAVSGLLRRPILVVPLDQLPHSSADPANAGHVFTEDERKARAVKLKRLAMKTLPQGNTWWRVWDWQELAKQRGPNGATGHSANHHLKDKTAGPVLPALAQRRQGAYRPECSVILAPDRRWSLEAEWSNQLARDSDAAGTALRAGAIKHYIFLHELGHALQRQESHKLKTWEQSWHAELDADRFAFAQMDARAGRTKDPEEAQALRETVQAMKHARALKGFLGNAWAYLFAPALDAVPEPAPDACRLAVYEMWVRVYARLTRQTLVGDSAQVQGRISTWISDDRNRDTLLDEAFGQFKWGEVSADPAQAIPALRTMLDAGEFTDPLARKTVQQVLDAAEYFRPPAPTHPRPANSPAAPAKTI